MWDISIQINLGNIFVIKEGINMGCANDGEVEQE